MKWYNIINFLLCVIILHLLLQNLDNSYQYSINEGFYCNKDITNNSSSIIEEPYNNPDDDLYNFINGPMPSNEYSSNDGKSNFQSNVVDVNSFYDIESKKLEEEFTYKNELPMNGGGKLGGIMGFDDKEYNLASIDNSPLTDERSSSITDLRNGMMNPQ